MSIYSGPNTTQSGLVLHIDPSNPRSYPGSGTTIFDISGNGNNGTLTNGASVVSQRSGRALDFDGVNDTVNVSNVVLSSEFTGSAWFYKRTDGFYKERIFLGNQANFNTYLANIGLNYITTQSDNDNTSKKFSFSTISILAWYHVAVVRDASNNVRVFLNGIQSVSGSQSVTASYTLNRIGQYANGISINNEFRWDGQLDDIRIYNRALTPQEIINNFNATRGRYGI